MNYQEYENQWIELPKLHKVLRTPFSLDIEITNKCNLNCSHCPFHKPDPIYKREPMDMNFELYKQIIDEISKKDTKAIKFNFGGEPTIYPLLVEAVQYAKDKGIIEIIINSNGILLTPSLGADLCETGMTKLIVSDYDIPKQVENIEAFILIKEFYDCKLIINKVECSDKWKDLEVDKIVSSNFYDFDKIKEDYIPSLFKCSYPWQRFIVLVDGTVMACSCGSIDPSKIIGSIPKNTIEELWNSYHMNQLRNAHKNLKSHEIEYCRRCHLRKEYLVNEYKKELGLYEI